MHGVVFVFLNKSSNKRTGCDSPSGFSTLRAETQNELCKNLSENAWMMYLESHCRCDVFLLASDPSRGGSHAPLISCDDCDRAPPGQTLLCPSCPRPIREQVLIPKNSCQKTSTFPASFTYSRSIFYSSVLAPSKLFLVLDVAIFGGYLNSRHFLHR